MPVWLFENEFALKSSWRCVHQADPWNCCVPLFVETEIVAPELRPYSAAKLEVRTLTSEIESMFGSKWAKQLAQPVSMSVAPSTEYPMMPVLPLKLSPPKIEPPDASRPVLVSTTPGISFM